MDFANVLVNGKIIASSQTKMSPERMKQTLQTRKMNFEKL